MSKRIIIILSIVLVSLFGITAFLMATNIQKKQNHGYDMVNNSINGARQSQAEAIEQAEAWSPPPDQMCTMVLTDAIHEDTGAEYTFPSGCLAPGWKPAN